MKKPMVTALVLLLLLAWAGGMNTVEESPVALGTGATDSDIAVLKEPPILNVVCGEQSLEAHRGNSFWMYENENGMSEGVIFR